LKVTSPFQISNPFYHKKNKIEKGVQEYSDEKNNNEYYKGSEDLSYNNIPKKIEKNTSYNEIVNNNDAFLLYEQQKMKHNKGKEDNNWFFNPYSSSRFKTCFQENDKKLNQYVDDLPNKHLFPSMIPFYSPNESNLNSNSNYNYDEKPNDFNHSKKTREVNPAWRLEEDHITAQLFKKDKPIFQVFKNKGQNK